MHTGVTEVVAGFAAQTPTANHASIAVMTTRVIEISFDVE